MGYNTSVPVLSEVEKRFVGFIGWLSLLCISLFLVRVAVTGVWRFSFVVENLALAWLGLFFGWLLANQLLNRNWLSWQNVLLTILWLMFLPNTWYVLTDFIHVSVTGEISQLYDIVLIATLVFSGFIMGFASLFIVHREFLGRLGRAVSAEIVTLVILLSSFTIYLGRDLRWNTWDVITNPAGVVLNVSDRVIDPLGNPRALNVTALFFILIWVMYFGLWSFIGPKKDKSR